MSHHRLANVLKLYAGGQDHGFGRLRAGTITSIGPDGTTARVTILPEGTLSGWLPVGSVGVGANSIICPPNIDDVVLLEPLEGDAENWVITDRIFTTSAPAPNSPATGGPIKPGEVAIILACGSHIHLAADGNVYGKAATQWNLIGDIHQAGTLYTDNVVAAGNVTMLGHIHSQDNDGHGDTEVPTNAPTPGH